MTQYATSLGRSRLHPPMKFISDVSRDNQRHVAVHLEVLGPVETRDGIFLPCFGTRLQHTPVAVVCDVHRGCSTLLKTAMSLLYECEGVCGEAGVLAA
ncbi:hypothetical protein MPTK1_3g22020 [Marchantia polymorpha subsp. ruderalis]|uniref:Uncharacterized protein n=2 Tax=Marchantia polymorpha TaxID=3197 RepID=A0AAF6B3F6_MARPO|nr:hypothetical protein MARPO_0089s0015 [Marchantia polymorpha]BBN06540.1 hypothetical protein Mp_3g22020 [Marchantia polymorpha subsp. ruderalis]|eukprot:PTQ33379.1 hypothetical protein MARPO_0089s0015 [Marchantia polymorpha]